MPVSERVSTRKPKTRKRTSARRLALGGAAAGAVALLVTGCGTGGDDASSSIVRTTTNIAGASVVGIERDTTHACALPSAPDQASGTHTVAGTQVPADPKRIVVLDTAALDAVCAVGLWERVVGATTAAGPAPQPNYLGTGVLKIPSVGSSGAVDTAKISALQPDLILGAAGDGDLAALRGIAPTVLVDHRGWQDDFTAYAEALGRGSAGAKALADYRTDARETGASIAANLSQASVIRFSPKDIQVQGTDTFAGQVLTDAGVQRPGAQRDRSFTVDSLATESDRNKIEGDIIYLMFDGPDGKSHGESVMKGDDWKALGAVSDKRDFAVEDDLWHGSGLTAARAILDDLRKTLNGYVTD
ncbi:iron-siderophore ABC transporter substrate-binding protein [Nocardia violaceofusca]|uniref:iron-siderophore ABC transporter substrate-binding protein n=1 Tax=Nocardia violaceofusca TaxID=941182 RepID=UPI0007A52769|nr:iron-siderophore ABC transporter substrate-binding protein [Nocardia violaceofusca]